MGDTRPPIPSKLFVGMIARDPLLFDACAEILKNKFGPVDLRAPIKPWNQTEYYRDEMGTGLLRTFIFFEQLVDQATLPDVKCMANMIEKRFAETGTGNRMINLDPGYITEAKVVLASTKDFSHRVYVGQRIYAEVTLQFRERGRTFLALDHTYPDFRQKDTIELFNRARGLLRDMLKKSKPR